MSNPPSTRAALVALLLVPTLSHLATSCASDQHASEPDQSDACAVEAEELSAWVAAVAGSRSPWWWEPAGTIVLREGDPWPVATEAPVAIEVDESGHVTGSVAEASTLGGAVRAARHAPLGVAFHADAPMRRVRQVLRRLQREGANEIDLVFAQYRPVGPPTASHARPLLLALDGCTECAALREQLRVRVTGECAELAEVLWPDVDATRALDDRVAASRAWSASVGQALRACECRGVDVDALWDLAWHQLSRPAPLTSVRLTFAGDRRDGVRTIALADDVAWADAQQAFAEAAPFPVQMSAP